MSGQSYSCPMCGTYLGRGRERVQAHTFADCLIMAELNVEQLRDKLSRWEQHLRELRRLEDTGTEPDASPYALLREATARGHESGDSRDWQRLLSPL